MTHEPPASVELAPCPFCGGGASLIRTIGWSANCDSAPHDCSVGPETTDFVTQAEAIAAWNTRASTPARPTRESILSLIRSQMMSSDYPVSPWEEEFASQILAIFDGASA